MNESEKFIVKYFVPIAIIVGVFGYVRSCLGCSNKTDNKAEPEKQEQTQEEKTSSLQKSGAFEVTLKDGSKASFVIG